MLFTTVRALVATTPKRPSGLEPQPSSVIPSHNMISESFISKVRAYQLITPKLCVGSVCLQSKVTLRLKCPSDTFAKLAKACR